MLYIAATDETGIIEPRADARPITAATLAQTHDLGTVRVIEELRGHFYWDELVEVEDYVYGLPVKMLRHR